MKSFEVNNGYRVIPNDMEKIHGIECERCKLRFKHEQAMGYDCTDPQCPIQARCTNMQDTKPEDLTEPPS